MSFSDAGVDISLALKWERIIIFKMQNTVVFEMGDETIMPQLHNIEGNDNVDRPIDPGK